MTPPKKILVAPLNWGLGHASRCIPIINELIRQGAIVYLASDGRALELLKKEFPNLPFFQLPSYGVNYSSKNFFFNIIKQTPQLLNAVLKENRHLKKIISENKIDGVISDNRLGCFSKKIPSVFISHQINLILPSSFFQWAARQVNYFFIKKYKECWVPDVSGKENLSGKLSHNTPLKFLKYIGALSRMKKYNVEKKHDVVVVLSGPEPQRTILEEVIINQAAKLPYSFLVVQGKTEEVNKLSFNGNVKVITSLASEQLNEAILSAQLYIGRTGYSTLMDLAKLKKPAILIPTPGQTEQEYLGGILNDKNVFQIKSQSDLNLLADIPAAFKKRNLEGGFFNDEKIKTTIRQFLTTCG